MLFTTPEKIEALAKKLVRKIGVAELVKTRDLVKEQLTTLMGRIADLQTKAEQLVTEIETLRRKGADLAATGGDPMTLTKRIRESEAAISEVKNWLVQLETKRGEMVSSLFEAEKALWDAIEQAVRELTPTYEKIMNAHLRAATELKTSWLRAVRQVYADIQGPGIRPAERTKDRNVNRHTFPLGVDRSLSLFAYDDAMASRIGAL